MTSFNFSKKYLFSSLVPTVTLIYSGISYKAMGLTITPCFIKLVNKSFASKLPLKDMKFPWVAGPERSGQVDLNQHSGRSCAENHGTGKNLGV